MLPSCRKWSVFQLMHHLLVAWTAALFLSFLFDHLVPTLLLFLVLSPSLRHESSRDSAAFRGAPRSPSGYDLLAAAVWSEGSAATGKQRRPHPFHHCSPPRTRTPPRAPHKVSTKAHLIMTVKDYFICVVIVKFVQFSVFSISIFQKTLKRRRKGNIWTNMTTCHSDTLWVSVNIAPFSQSHANISEDRWCGYCIPFRATLFVCCLHGTIQLSKELDHRDPCRT